MLVPLTGRQSISTWVNVLGCLAVLAETAIAVGRSSVDFILGCALLLEKDCSYPTQSRAATPSTSEKYPSIQCVPSSISHFPCLVKPPPHTKPQRDPHAAPAPCRQLPSKAGPPARVALRLVLLAAQPAPDPQSAPRPQQQQLPRAASDQSLHPTSHGHPARPRPRGRWHRRRRRL